MTAPPTPTPRKASPAAYNIIKEFEGLELKAYLCPAHVWTIGWGHTASVKPGDVVTEAQAETLLAADVAPVERDLPKVVHVPLTQGQFDALLVLQPPWRRARAALHRAQTDGPPQRRPAGRSRQ